MWTIYQRKNTFCKVFFGALPLLGKFRSRAVFRRLVPPLLKGRIYKSQFYRQQLQILLLKHQMGRRMAGFVGATVEVASDLVAGVAKVSLALPFLRIALCFLLVLLSAVWRVLRFCFVAAISVVFIEKMTWGICYKTM